ncbi:DEAD/DEAH box helicase family protein [Spiroplasma cantharicola]|uniref:ATP-dependent helicase IRC3 n=1 Tax=Spiroplasma cantharicola TaxID=362837 RepID=A0A0M4KC73_9MOLU|nr:DEAD/DEAH box helicase family protein [Spiroplasma cantharicola]ALD66252.1 ATP-dependent helicase IRC3 [Spiroplasma cantharicola]
MNEDKFFTNKDEQELLTEIQNEILTSDEVYLIYPFISKTILNKISLTFDYCLKNKIIIKIISTTFDDLSQFNNLYELKKLVEKYSNIQIKIEDNLEKHSERIHIKAAIFKRKTNLDSAIIGSSNLTYKGMISGREWNIKIISRDSNDLVQKMIEEFDILWNENLVDFSDVYQRDLLIQKVKENQDQKNSLQLTKIDSSTNYIKKNLYKFQKDIIDKLSYRRFQGKNKHLIVMATGTGKTLVSAFDFKRQIETVSKNLSILFLAHQREIVDQALKTYREVLNEPNFGEVLYDGKIISEKPLHLFATIQSLSNKIDNFSKEQFDILVFDEAHHMAANSFERTFNFFKPKQIIGLTATPEREDGKDIKKYFHNEFASELRLWDAINQKLLCSFDYYCIDDTSTDLQGIDINSDREIFRKINTDSRNELLYKTIEKYLGVYARPTALIFCVTIEHANIISNFLKQKNLKAECLTAENSKDRKKILYEFSTGRINYLCVVNIFNEGIDIPEINTIILLRPTNSKTVYLQQLGRGLRKTELKSKLEVYDLISNIDNKYDLTLGIRNLFNSKIIGTNFNSIKNGLPYNSTITLEKHTEQIILQSLKKWYGNKNIIKSKVVKYYNKYKHKALEKIIADYELSLQDFYNVLDDLFLKTAREIINYSAKENNTSRNKNILKQFIFLDNYQIINYFLKRLKGQIDRKHIDLDFDNLLMTSFLYEITSIEKFLDLYPNYLEIKDLIEHFIENNKLIVEELILILEYKLKYEILIFEESNNKLLSINSTYTVKQCLSVIGRTNFLHYRDEMKVLTFQAGYLTFDNSKQVILADEDGNGYGKLTKYDQDNNKFYWSIPEKMSMEHKIIKDFSNEKIKKYLFLHDKQNYDQKNMFLKLYKFIGIGQFTKMQTENYLTAEFDVL